jgi:adenine-specific DNA glycosylase
MKPTLVEILISLYPNATPAIDWNVQRVNDKAEIVSWDTKKLGPQPSSEIIANKEYICQTGRG